MKIRPIGLKCRQLADPEAPLIPRVSNTSGATQQSEPTIAATTPAHNCLVAVCMGCSLHHVLRYGVKHDWGEAHNWLRTQVVCASSNGRRRLGCRCSKRSTAKLLRLRRQREPAKETRSLAVAKLALVEEQAGGLGATTRCAAGLSGSVRSTARDELPNHRAARVGLAHTGASHPTHRRMNECVTSAAHFWYNGASRDHLKTRLEAT